MSSSRRFADERGQLIVLTAVTMVGLLGFVALTLDGGFMYAKRNRLYAAADAAAKSAAFEVHRNTGISSGDLRRFAEEEVRAHQFTPVACGATSGGASLCLTRPAPGYSDNFVEAVVSESTNTFFGRVMGWVSGFPGGRAVAGVGNPNNCIIVNEDMAIGNTQLTLNNCGAGIGGDLAGNNPNSAINGAPTPPVNVTGTCSGTCGAMGDLTTGAPTPIDPLAGLPNPDPVALSGGLYPASCVIGSAATLNPGCYSKIESTVSTLNPGDYVVTGTINIGNLSSNPGPGGAGSGVFIYLQGSSARLQAGNNQDIHLKARTTATAGDPAGTYVGIAIWQERGNITNFTVGNNFTIHVNGAIYMPSVDVDFQNSVDFQSTNCSLFIAKSLSIRNGSGDMGNNGCAATFGGAAFLSVVVVE